MKMNADDNVPKYDDGGQCGSNLPPSSAGAVSTTVEVKHEWTESECDAVPVIGESVILKIKEEFDDDWVRLSLSSVDHIIKDPLSIESTPKASTLNSSLKTHQGDFTEVCSLCGSEFSFKKSMDVHVKSKHVGEQQYVCNLCSRKGPPMLTHTGPFSCDHCDFTTQNQSQLRLHMVNHPSEDPLHDPLTEDLHTNDCHRQASVVPAFKDRKEEMSVGCRLCSDMFTSKRSLDIHIVRAHAGEKPYECNLCDYKTAANRSLKRHMQKHEGLFRCGECGFSASDPYYLQKHMRTHSDFKPFECHICDCKTKSKASLDIHIRTHTGEMPYCCELCGHLFKAASGLISHLKTTHNDEKRFSCDLCDFRTKTAQGLRNHMATHREDKPLQCALCDFRTKNKVGIKRHMKRHSGNKPYSCDLCQFRCISRAYLRHHSRLHTGEKPFACNMCDYRTANRSNLNTHKRTHTGDRPYHCNICDSRFTQSSSLKSHKKKLHPEQEAEK